MGLEVLQGFMGASGGGSQKSDSTSQTAKSGDANATNSIDFSGMNNSFQLGGRGTTSASATNDKSTGTATNNTALYVALGIAGFAVVGVLVWSAMHKA